MTLEEQLKEDDGHRFQKELGDFIAFHNLAKVVETGTGVTSIYILKSFDDNNIDGKLFSIDKGQWYPHEIIHPKFQQIVDKSIPSLLNLYLEIGEFDFFLHDGEHEVKVQEYEYEFAYQCLKPGGYIASDDICWGNNTCWPDFLKRHNLKDEIMGAIRITQKPLTEPVLGVEVSEFGSTFNKDAVIEFHDEWLAHCENLEKEWLAAGNTKHPIFQ